MKKRIIIAIVLFSLFASAALILLDFNSYASSSKTVECEKSGGIIFSITTFDGKNETEPFVKSFGHSWLSIDNQTDHSVYMRGNEIKSGEIITFSIWAISNHFGTVYNLESNFINDYGRYKGRRSLSINIDEEKLKIIDDYIERNGNWTLGKNCSYFSIQLWNKLADDECKLKTQAILYSPKRLIKSLNEFDCIEIDKDFSKAENVFFYENGIKTELDLCY